MTEAEIHDQIAAVILDEMARRDLSCSAVGTLWGKKDRWHNQGQAVRRALYPSEHPRTGKISYPTLTTLAGILTALDLRIEIQAVEK